jgi:hypothetical protein
MAYDKSKYSKDQIGYYEAKMKAIEEQQQAGLGQLMRALPLDLTGLGSLSPKKKEKTDDEIFQEAVQAARDKVEQDALFLLTLDWV